MVKWLLAASVPQLRLHRLQSQHPGEGKGILHRVQDVHDAPVEKERPSKSYVKFLKTNRQFRIFLMSYVCNRLGEWLTYLSSVSAVESMSSSTSTTSGRIIGQLLVARILPNIILTPFGGVLADGCRDRRQVMMALDLLGGVVALLFVVACWSNSIAMIYIATFLQECLTGLYEPSRSALPPLLVRDKDGCTNEEDLKKATTIMGIAYSAVAALGAALGGVLVGIVGNRACFLIDSLTYAVSALLMMIMIGDTSVPTSKHKGTGTGTNTGTNTDTARLEHESLTAYAARMIYDGMNYLCSTSFGPLVLLKACAAMVYGGFDVLYVGFAQKWDGDDGGGDDVQRHRSVRLGMIVAASGVGCLLGPLFSNPFMDMKRPETLQRTCVAAFAIMAFGAFLLSLCSPDNLWMICLFVALRSVGTNAIYIGSRLLLQKLSAPSMLGRVLSIENLLLLSAQATSSYMAGVLLDVGELSVEQVSAVLGLLALLFLSLWGIYHAQGRGAAIGCATTKKDIRQTLIQGLMKRARRRFFLPMTACACVVVAGYNIINFHYMHLPVFPVDGGLLLNIPAPLLKPPIMWSLNESESYTMYCRAHHVWNDTWGREIAPYVDKLGAKYIVPTLDSSVRTVPTLAHYDTVNISEFTLETMQTLQEPYIIKATHTSGGVARVYNGTYECFKGCIPEVESQGSIPIGPRAVELAQKQMRHDLESDYGLKYGERQYSFVTPRIIVEEHLRMGVADDPWKWYVIHGQPLYVVRFCCELDAQGRRQRKGVFRRSTRFRNLPIVDSSSPGCADNITKPKEWEKMHDAAINIGKRIPGLVRIDLYPLDGQVYFSELTFTPQRCFPFIRPLVTESLLMHVLLKKIRPSDATAEFVERTINSRSWKLVSPAGSNDENRTIGYPSYPSPLDLCVGLASESSRERMLEPSASFINNTLFQSCMDAGKQVVASNYNYKGGWIHSWGGYKIS